MSVLDGFYTSWVLGDDYDCETCGRTFNEVGCELWDEENNVWQVFLRVGCYGGFSVLSDASDWDEKIGNIVQEVKKYSAFKGESYDEFVSMLEQVNRIKNEGKNGK